MAAAATPSPSPLTALPHDVLVQIVECLHLRPRLTIVRLVCRRLQRAVHSSIRTDRLLRKLIPPSGISFARLPSLTSLTITHRDVRSPPVDPEHLSRLRCVRLSGANNALSRAANAGLLAPLSSLSSLIVPLPGDLAALRPLLAANAASLTSLKVAWVPPPPATLARLCMPALRELKGPACLLLLLDLPALAKFRPVFDSAFAPDTFPELTSHTWPSLRQLNVGRVDRLPPWVASLTQLTAVRLAASQPTLLSSVPSLTSLTLCHATLPDSAAFAQALMPHTRLCSLKDVGRSASDEVLLSAVGSRLTKLRMVGPGGVGMAGALVSSVTNLEELALVIGIDGCTLLADGEWRLPRLRKLAVSGDFQSGVALVLQCLQMLPSLRSVSVHSDTLSLEPELPQWTQCLDALFVHCNARAGEVSVRLRSTPTHYMPHLAALARTHPWAAISVVESLL